MDLLFWRGTFRGLQKTFWISHARSIIICMWLIRGKSKVMLVGYKQLLRSKNRANNIRAWLKQAHALASQIEKRRGKPVDVDAILSADREDLESR